MHKQGYTLGLTNSASSVHILRYLFNISDNLQISNYLTNNFQIQFIQLYFHRQDILTKYLLNVSNT